jgi:hypothetical protein
MLDHFARLKLDESVRKIVSPTTKGLIRLTLFCRPLHRRPISNGSRQSDPMYDVYNMLRLGQNGSNLVEHFGVPNS